ncbi:MAG: hypothetical protein ACYC91_09015 [Solirubrobacteraceae bacterium]
MPALKPTTTLPALRVALGAGAWALPELTGKAFGIEMSDSQNVLLGRLFGVRDLVLGIGTLAAKRDGRLLWWQMGILCDLADAAAAILWIRSSGPNRANLMTVLTAVGAVAAGVATLSEL